MNGAQNGTNKTERNSLGANLKSLLGLLFNAFEAVLLNLLVMPNDLSKCTFSH